jgi:hypothetical protein
MTSTRKHKPRRAWQAYWLLGITVYVLTIASGLDPDVPRVPAITDFVVAAICFAGLFGYAFRRRVLNAAIWKAVFVGTVIWDPVYLFLLLPEPPGEQPGSLTLLVGGVISVAMLLKYFGLCLYAFGSADIWGRAGAA